MSTLSPRDRLKKIAMQALVRGAAAAAGAAPVSLLIWWITNR
ncbi:hypothetical protein OHS59_06735 [Streptomyces sp. NBC_00414]